MSQVTQISKSSVNGRLAVVAIGVVLMVVGFLFMAAIQPVSGGSVTTQTVITTVNGQVTTQTVTATQSIFTTQSVVTTVISGQTQYVTQQVTQTVNQYVTQYVTQYITQSGGTQYVTQYSTQYVTITTGTTGPTAYPIAFSTNTGSGSIFIPAYGTTYTNGQTIQLPSGSFTIQANTPSGYSFAGWNWSGVGISVASAGSGITTLTIDSSGCSGCWVKLNFNPTTTATTSVSSTSFTQCNTALWYTAKPPQEFQINLCAGGSVDGTAQIPNSQTWPFGCAEHDNTGGSACSVPTNGNLPAGSGIQITAHPNTAAGFVFDHWTVNGGTVTGNPISVTMPTGPLTVNAYFKVCVTCTIDRSHFLAIFQIPSGGLASPAGMQWLIGIVVFAAGTLITIGGISSPLLMRGKTR